MLYKTIAPLGPGVDTSVRPSVISPFAWLTLQQMRSFRKRITNFPGWKTILASGNVGGFGSLATEYTKFDGTTFLIAAGPSKVFKYDAGTKTLTDISGALTFAPTRDKPWWPFFYKDELYITNRVDGLFKWTASGNVVAVAGSPPKALVGEVLKDHICLFNVNDGTERPTRFQWSAEAAPTVWTPLVTNDAGAFDLDDSPDTGTGLAHLGDDIILYKDRTIVPVTFIGGNEVFGRRTSISGIGLLGPYALVNTGATHVFAGPDTFYEYRGGLDVDDTIGLKIRDKVYPVLHPSFKNRIRALIIEETREILFFYADTTSLNDPNQCVIFNFEEGEWYGPFPIVSTMTGFTSRSQTLVIDSVTSIIDTVADLIDSFATTIGAPQNVFVDASGVIHEIGAAQDANGVAITRLLESGDHFLGADAVDESGQPVTVPLGSVFGVSSMLLETDMEGVSGTAQLRLGFRMELNDLIQFTSPVTFDLGSTQNVKIPVRATGRWFRTQITVPNSAILGLIGYQYEFGLAGRR